MSLKERVQRAWNLFSNRDPTDYAGYNRGQVSYQRPDRYRIAVMNERSIIAAIMARISTDVSQIDIRHVKLDEKGRYVKDINSSLNSILTFEANKDQTGRAFRHDIGLSLIDEGCIALTPIDTDDDIDEYDNFQVFTMRVAKIVEWSPDDVKIDVYNDRDGKHYQKVVPKRAVGIVENPFYPVMNEPNSTLKRLTKKLNMLDEIDELTSSGKLDIIIQLPWAVKGAAKRAAAEKRRKDIEKQLVDSKYGIAYIDANEHITQLNRPAENNLMSQVQYLTDMLFSQLCITQSILDGTADEQTYNNYYTNTIEPIVAAVTDELKRKFLTKTAITQGQSIMYFRDPFRLMSATKIAEVGGKLISAEVLTKNEVRGLIGFRPVEDPEADQLINPNINKKGEATQMGIPGSGESGNNTSTEEVNTDVETS